MASETVQARQAALLLHGLPSAVREQVIAKLDTREATRVKPLLDELVGLGVSPAMGRQLQTAAATQAATPGAAASGVPVRELTARERLEQLNADDVARALQSCSTSTVAQLLRAQTWSWKAQLLGLIPEPRRARVLEGLRRESPGVAPAVLELLCERVLQEAARLKTIRSQPAATRATVVAPRSSVGARLRRFIRWTR